MTFFYFQNFGNVAGLSGAGVQYKPDKQLFVKVFSAE
jgi:hypothetical protein